MIQHKYSDCSYCGGKVKPSKVTVDLMHEARLYLFEKVPAGACVQCGEKYFIAKVAKLMDASIRKNQWKRFVKTPVMSFPQLTST